MMKPNGFSCLVFLYDTMFSSTCTNSKKEYTLVLLENVEEKSCKPSLYTVWHY